MLWTDQGLGPLRGFILATSSLECFPSYAFPAWLSYSSFGLNLRFFCSSKPFLTSSSQMRSLPLWIFITHHFVSFIAHISACESDVISGPVLLNSSPLLGHGVQDGGYFGYHRLPSSQPGIEHRAKLTSYQLNKFLEGQKGQTMSHLKDSISTTSF